MQKNNSSDEQKLNIMVSGQAKRGRHISSKLEAIKAIVVPTKVKNIHSFVVIVNYYRDMWRKSANKLAPLTKLCSTRVKFKWTDVENNVFIATKKY